MQKPETATQTTTTRGWMFVIQDGRLRLKINGAWADDELLSYSRTPGGIAEIQRQWAKYDRIGQPFLSYQNPTAGDED